MRRAPFCKICGLPATFQDIKVGKSVLEEEINYYCAIHAREKYMKEKEGEENGKSRE